MGLRLFAQSCRACGGKWMKVTVGDADTVCPYCLGDDVAAVQDPDEWPLRPPPGRMIE